jgi:Fic family protein
MARGRPSRATIYRRLASALDELNDRFGGLPSPKESETVWSDIWHLEAHHSTALEGNTLVLREVAVLLDQRRAVGAKPLKEYMEVEGYSDAARWVYGQALDPDDWSDGGLINLNEVRRIHHMAMTPVWAVAPHPDATAAESPGSFRQHEIAQFDGGMTPPPWPEVPALLADWVAEVVAVGNTVASSTELDVPLPEELARLHHRFECIHPFIDGNGRAGRLALNLVLVRLGYPPVVIFKKQRDAYLRALQRADEDDHGALGEIIARAMLDNLNRFVVPNVAGPARLVPLVALADDQFSVPALRQAAQRGRLDAVQGADGIWRSSRNAVNEYAAMKHSRRPSAT